MQTEHSAKDSKISRREESLWWLYLISRLSSHVNYIFNSQKMSLREMQKIILYKMRFNSHEITVNIENSKI